MENNYTVYTHISPSNKRYVGITKVKVEERWRKNGEGYKTQIFYRAIEKYGWDNFQHIIIAKGLTKEEAEWLEIELIKVWDTTNRDKGYNIVEGGNAFDGLQGELNPNYGRTHSEETRRKISESRIGKYFGEENPFYGRTHSEETRRKISEKAMGRTSPMKGKTGELASCYGREHSDEEKEKILLSQPTRQEVYCIELNMAFPSLSQAERYIKSTFNIVFSRRTLTDKLKKENIVSYKEVLIDDVLTELHWKYI